MEDYIVTIDENNVSLTKKEIEILWTLAVNKNKVFSRENLLNSLWGYDYYGDSRTVDSHIKRLRSKIDNFQHKNWEIKTIWGVGYKFEVYDEK
jgi:DNA-binding response OmpR family regulator